MRRKQTPERTTGRETKKAPEDCSPSALNPVAKAVLDRHDGGRVTPWTALETIRRHHRFRSRAITELCEGIAASAAGCATLTRRELEILRLIAQDLSSKEIASELGLSIRTIETHRTNLFRKLKVRSVVGLVRYAIYHGVVEL